MKHHTIDINNVNLHYVESGANSANDPPRKTIFFLPGFPEDWGTWQAQQVQGY